ncbi:SDR family NAD(P)-dependent oxidoreductase [Sinorhizobium meliloti]|nr:SDR family NAD(P)-dependent oxidoreductase [Sinorhizobium meliloti]
MRPGTKQRPIRQDSLRRTGCPVNDATKGFIGELDDLDVVVNCAGIIRRGQERDPDVFDTVVDINLNGTMRVCEASLDRLAATTAASSISPQC